MDEAAYSISSRVKWQHWFKYSWQNSWISCRLYRLSAKDMVSFKQISSNRKRARWWLWVNLITYISYHFIISGLVQTHIYVESVLHTLTNKGASTQKDLHCFIQLPSPGLYVNFFFFFLSLHYLLNTVFSIFVTIYLQPTNISLRHLPSILTTPGQ